MPLQKLQFRPGISRESTDYANEGGWYSCDNVRFRSGAPEKIGGWVGYPTVTVGPQYLGICRHIVEWVTTSTKYILGVGTSLKYYVNVQDNTYQDITPIRRTVTLGTDPIRTLYTTLNGALDATTTVIPISAVNNLSDINSFGTVAPFTFRIGSEQIYVYAVDTTAKTLGTTASPCVRGVNSTPASTHVTGAVVSSQTVTLVDAGSGATANDFVTLSGAVNASGYSMNAEWQVVNVGSSYVAVNTDVWATSSIAFGGTAVVAAYQINTQPIGSTSGYGWGMGGWGMGGWGVGSIVSQPYIGTRLWTGDSFGSDLVFCPRGDGVYLWNPDTQLDSLNNVTGRGVHLRNLTGADGYAPLYAKSVMVSSERHVIAFGCTDTTSSTSTTLDPLNVAWSDMENPLVWHPQVTNLAGNYRLGYGSDFVAWEKTRQETLIWTDSALYSMRYVGAPYVYSFNVITNEITIASPNCSITANNITYWMGLGKFYAYSGRVDTLPCSLRQFVFDDFNKDQRQQVHAGTNENYNEIWWFYCSKDSSVINRCVIYNYLEQIWYYGSLPRTAWLDSHIKGIPYGATYGNVLVQHEVGSDDQTTGTPAAIPAYIESADFDIGDGDSFSFVKRLIPDVDFIGSDPATAPHRVDVTLYARDFPGQGSFLESQATLVSATETPVPAVSPMATAQVFDYTPDVWLRLRGRQIAFRIESSTVGIKWQLGVPRILIQQDGRKS